jgi:hypothetical protein
VLSTRTIYRYSSCGPFDSPATKTFSLVSDVDPSSIMASKALLLIGCVDSGLDHGRQVSSLGQDRLRHSCRFAAVLVQLVLVTVSAFKQSRDDDMRCRCLID